MATDSSITLLTLGGLANRMRAIASAVALAHDTRRPLRVIWPVNNELRARFDDLFHPFHAGVDLHNVSEARALWLYRPARKRNLYLSPLLRTGRFTAVYSDDDSLRTENAPEILAAIKSARGSVLLRAGTFFYPCGNDAYRHLFRPVEAVRTEADKVLALLGDDATGFHIRRTDNTVSITESPIEAFITEAENEFALHPGRKIYLATDDNEVKHLFHARFPGKTVTTPATADRRSLSGMRHALTEMLVLAGCARIIGSFYSSYSEAAAILGDTPLRQLRRATSPASGE